jgi:threonine synthase
LEPHVITQYDLDAVSKVLNRRKIESRSAAGVWRYKELMPIFDEDNMVTLYEGNTPLIKCKKLGEKIDLENLYVKDEGRNPTCSYKDRLIAVAASKAREVKAKFLISHGGNTGAPCAAYATRAGLPAITLESPSVVRGEVGLTIGLGGRSVMFEHKLPLPFTAKRKIMMEAVKHGGYSVSPVGIHGTTDPYGHDGLKTLGYEICEQLHWKAPDWVLGPVGAAGSNLWGAWHGCKEFNELGFVSTLPHMAACQPAAAAPLVKAIQEKLDYVPYVQIQPTHIAKAVDPTSSYKGLRAVRDSKGDAVAVEDGEAWEMEKALALTEGIAAGSASAMSLASARKLREEGKIDKDEIVVCTLSSHGQKETDRNIDYRTFTGGGGGQLPEKSLVSYDSILFKDEPTWENFAAFVEKRYGLTIA